MSLLSKILGDELSGYMPTTAALADPPTLSRAATAPPGAELSILPPPIPCLFCSCPAIWSSIYEPGAYRCCDCEPPPAASLIAHRWLIVLEDRGDTPDGQIDWQPTWQEMPLRDWRREPWRPDSATQPAGDDRVGIDPATGRPHVAGFVPDDANSVRLAYDHDRNDPPWRLDPIGVRVGTLIDHAVPSVVMCDDGALLTVFLAGWSPLLRLIVHHGFERAWQMLGER